MFCVHFFTYYYLHSYNTVHCFVCGYFHSFRGDMSGATNSPYSQTRQAKPFWPTSSFSRTYLIIAPNKWGFGLFFAEPISVKETTAKPISIKTRLRTVPLLAPRSCSERERVGRAENRARQKTRGRTGRVRGRGKLGTADTWKWNLRCGNNAQFPLVKSFVACQSKPFNMILILNPIWRVVLKPV